MNGQLNGFLNNSLSEEDCFLFTSESVGEGHPGKFGRVVVPSFRGGEVGQHPQTRSCGPGRGLAIASAACCAPSAAPHFQPRPRSLLTNRPVLKNTRTDPASYQTRPRQCKPNGWLFKVMLTRLTAGLPWLLLPVNQTPVFTWSP